MRISCSKIRTVNVYSNKTFNSIKHTNTQTPRPEPNKPACRAFQMRKSKAYHRDHIVNPWEFKISFKTETRDDLLRAKTFKLCVIKNKIKMDAYYEFVACNRKIENIEGGITHICKHSNTS